jgi:putative protein-disulfide isomerase
MGAEMEAPRLLAFLDTMCSWCYGFAPQMARIRAHFGDRLDYLTFSGGLRPFTKEPMDAKLRSKLAETYKKIGEMTGQPFQPSWLNDPAFIYDTEPASRAVVCLRHLAPGEDYAYQEAIQRAFYAGGEDITRAEVLARHAVPFGLDEATFLASFDSDSMRAATMDDFRVAQKFGIDGFPTLIIHRLDPAQEMQLMMVAKGFDSADDIIERIEAAIAPDSPLMN